MALVKIQVRRDTAANWTASNPVLADGEQGLETDTGKIKYGNGVQNWIALPYFVGVPLSSDTPTAVGTASAGTKSEAARADHSHALPSALSAASLSVTGNAAVAGSLSLTGPLLGGPHSHTPQDIPLLPAAIQQQVGGMLKAGGNIGVNYDKVGGTITITANGGGPVVSSVNGLTGDVTLTASLLGAAASVHGHKATTDLSDFPPVSGNGGRYLTTDGSNLLWGTVSGGGSGGGGSGVTDGDKGDIVVSNTGATWTIDSAVLPSYWRSLMANVTNASVVAALGAASNVHKGTHATGGSDALTPSDIGAVASNTTGITGSAQITNIVSLTQAQYDAIASPSSATLYVIRP